ncbi:MAG: 16S rRNA (uracil(1498)-N(3))-methyltransferase [Bacteroidales bacterium]
MQLFYAPEINQKSYTLTPEESRHIVRVLRLKEDSPIFLTDGKGNFYEAKVAEPDARKCKVNIIRKTGEYGKRKIFIHIAIAPTKNIKRFEWFLEKSTEIGVDEITPIICEHSERKHLRLDRLNNILIAAMKQAVKAYLPTIRELVKFEDFIKQPQDGIKTIAVCDNQSKPHLSKACVGYDRITILIGPEGDFSASEIESALSRGFKSVSLGSARLRTETAGIVACHIANLVNE